LGDDLIVAPVLNQGETSRRIYLPTGDWYDFWENSIFTGPGEFEVPVNLERLPVFVRAGSVLTFENNNRLELNIYPLSQGEYYSRLYSDSGDGYGRYRVDTFHMVGTRNRIDLFWDAEGEYPFPYTSIKLKVNHKEPLATLIDGKAFSVQNRVLSVEKFERGTFHF
jgi:alpha-glucosidase